MKSILDGEQFKRVQRLPVELRREAWLRLRQLEFRSAREIFSAARLIGKLIRKIEHVEKTLAAIEEGNAHAEAADRPLGHAS